MKQALHIFMVATCLLFHQNEAVAASSLSRATGRVVRFATIPKKAELEALKASSNDAFEQRDNERRTDMRLTAVSAILFGIVSGIQIIEGRNNFNTRGRDAFTLKAIATLCVTTGAACLSWRHAKAKENNTKTFWAVRRGE